MKTYLVGGAVRDELLKRKVTERDWVVVGATPDEMFQQGYIKVGKDFPVFLHPETKEEYALARTERKSGKGYYGFECNFDSTVTLEDDLLRRDLTVNAIAKDSDGNIIDPFNGVKDLENKVLRHVSKAFNEDPVRILRVARFMARYQPLGFSVADDTMQLMQSMVTAGEVDALVSERVWQEFNKALGEACPCAFIETLRESGALKILFPELDRLWGVPQRPEYHPEIDCGIHTMMVLDVACNLTDCKITRFAALCHDLGKGVTPKSELPSHKGHEARGVPLVNAVCDRYKIPKEYRDLAAKTSKWHLHVHRALELTPKTILKLFEALDLFRRPEIFEKFLIACIADARGRTGFENKDLPQVDYLRSCVQAVLAVRADEFVAGGLTGDKIKEALHKARLSKITAIKKEV